MRYDLGYQYPLADGAEGSERDITDVIGIIHQHIIYDALLGSDKNCARLWIPPRNGRLRVSDLALFVLEGQLWRVVLYLCINIQIGARGHCCNSIEFVLLCSRNAKHDYFCTICFFTAFLEGIYCRESL